MITKGETAAVPHDSSEAWYYNLRDGINSRAQDLD